MSVEKEFYKQREEIAEYKRKKLKDHEILRSQFSDAQLKAEQAGSILQPSADSKKKFSTKFQNSIEKAHNEMKAVIKKQNEAAIKQRRFEINEYRKKYGDKATQERLKKFYANKASR